MLKKLAPRSSLLASSDSSCYHQAHDHYSCRLRYSFVCRWHYYCFSTLILSPVTILPMIAVIAFLAVLSVLILIHEAGHFIAARIFGVKAEEFGYGLPPRAIGWVREGRKWKRVTSKDRTEHKHTIWSINWLPIGGFVRLKGENGENKDDKDSFHAKKVWQRFIIIAAGVLMNWLLAIVLFTIGFSFGTPAVLDNMPPGAIVNRREILIIDTIPGSPAQKAGIASMDSIVSINGQAPKNVDDIRTLIDLKPDGAIPIVIKRGSEDKTFDVTPVFMQEIDQKGIGVSLAESGIIRYPVHLAVVNSVRVTWEYTKNIAVTFVQLFKEMFTGGGETVKQVSGPVGIAVLAGRIAQRGIAQLIQFAAILSINLAVLNFLPIPALDGGRALFLVIEAIRRKPINRNIEALIHNIAFIILIALVILISVRDVGRLFGHG
jgi:regulator of sigma E protease